MRNAPAHRADGNEVHPPERSPGPPERRAARLAGPLAGLLVGGVALGIGQLAAALGTPAASPVVAVGEAAIDRSPEALRSWAIAFLGTRDKPALVEGNV